MSLLYDFKFGPTCAGLSAVVTDSAGAGVTGSPATLDSDGSTQLPLSEGLYQAVVGGATRHQTVMGVLNVPASIEAAMIAPAP